MRLLHTFAALAVLGAPAAAATLTPTATLPAGTEVVVGELRAGKGRADRQAGINDPANGGAPTQSGFAAPALGDGTYGFSFGVTGGGDVFLNLFGGAPATSISLTDSSYDLTGADSVLIRAYGDRRRDGTYVYSTTLSDLSVDDGSGFGTVLVGTDRQEDLALLSGLDFANGFKLEGKITFDGFGAGARGSQLAAQFKVYDTAPDVVGEIPLPAAAWLLLAGLGGLAATRRRA